MNDQSCCTPTASEEGTSCPVSGTSGKPVKLVTLKALLTPSALATLEPAESYRFCADVNCDVTYFSEGRTYLQADVKVPIYQKDPGALVPVCYCFGHTRADLERATTDGHAEEIPRSISAHVKAGRCGCEVNNPQGSCCLGNVNRAITNLREAKRVTPGAIK